MGIEEWLQAFAERRGGFEAIKQRGAPLHRLKCTNEEFDSLERVLSERLPARRGLFAHRTVECGALVLYAAEWYRRRFEGRSWSYDPMLAAIGVERPPYDEICNAIERGLGLFGRSVRRVGDRTRRLGTLIAEGGFPVAAIRNEGGRVREFFRFVLDEVGAVHDAVTVERAVSAHLDRLPEALRSDEMKAICVDLATEILALQALIPDGSPDPIVELDRRQPGWRDGLPLVLGDELADKLLRGLVIDAKRAVTRAGDRLRFSVTLVQRADGVFSLERRLDTPWLQPREIAEAFSVPENDLPHRLRLFALRPSGETVDLGLASLTMRDGERAYRIDAAGSRPVAIVDDGDVLLGATGVGQRSFDPAIIRGSDLSTLPWSFAPDESAPGCFRLIGVGSVRTPHSLIVTAVLPGSRWESTAPVKLGCTPTGAREIYRVEQQRRVVAPSDDAACTLRVGDAVSSKYTSWPVGSAPTGFVGRFPTFAGMPALYVDNGTRVRKAEFGALRWRPRGESGPWKTLGETPLGDIRVRMFEDGDLIADHAWTIVPPAAAAVVSPGPDERSCHLAFRGIGKAARVVATKTGDVELVRNDDATYTARTLRPGLSEFEVLVTFGDAERAVVRFPFAARGCRFVDREGRRLGDDELVSVNQLAGLVAQGFGFHERDRLNATCRLMGGTHESSRPLRFDERERLWKLPLRDLQTDVELLLSLSRTVEGAVRITAAPLGLAAGQTKLQVARYRFGVVRHDDSGQVALASVAADTLAGGTLARLSARAVRMSTLAAPDVLERVGDAPEWRFAPEAREPGAWLISIHDGEECVARPLRWFVPRRRGVDTTPSAAPLAAAVEVSNEEERAQALRTALRDLPARKDEDSWAFLERALLTLEVLPAETLDVIQFLAREDLPLLCALLRRSEPARTRRIWKGMEKTPLLWECVSLQSWADAADLVAGEKRAKFAQAELTESESEEALRDFFRPLRDILGQHAAMHTVGELLASRDAVAFPVDREPNLLTNLEHPVIGPLAFENLVLGPWGDLRRRHEPDVHKGAWPQVGQRSDRGRGFADLVSWLQGGRVPKLELLNGLDRMPFMNDVAQAPLMAAFVAVHRTSGMDIPIDTIAELKRFKAFDPEWFESAWRFFSAVLWAEKQKNVR